MKTNTAFRLRILSLVVAAICAGGARAQLAAGALPTGGILVGGQASLVQNGSTLNVHQTTSQALVNFTTFNVGSGALVDIQQPGAAAALLARVTGSDPSQIYGQIKANGTLWLINPAGIMVGQGARIDVGGFIASTLNVSDSDFLAGRLTFASPGAAGGITNAGTINAASGGRIYLVAPKVENTGTLNAPKGEVLLAAGQNVQLLDTGAPGVSIALSGAAGDVKNMGRIVAEAGRIGLGGALVTNAGEISASSAVSEGGRVFLRATDLKTTSSSDISASGTSGGQVILSADNTSIDGRVSAMGSIGTGGFVDTSGHVLNVKHAPTVGKGGQWLIDPFDLEVVAGDLTTAGDNGGAITSGPTGTTVGANTITDQLNLGANVSLATGDGGPGLGNIAVNAAIAKTMGVDATLTLRAHGNVTISAPITSTSGALGLELKNNFRGGVADPGFAATLAADLNLNGGRLDVSQGEAMGNGTLNITAGTTTLGNGSSIAAAAVNVQTNAHVIVDSEQMLQGAWNNAGQIDLVNNGSINVALVNPTGPATSLTNTGRITLAGSNGMALTGVTDTTDPVNLINYGEILKTSGGAQQISGLTNGSTGRLKIDAGQLKLDHSTLGGQTTLAPPAKLVLSDSNLAGGADITGPGAMVWSGNVTLLGDVTLGAAAPALSDDPDRFFTFVQASGHKLTTYNNVNIGKNLVLASGSTWDNFGAVTVGPASPGVLAVDPNSVFNNKAGGVLDVRDGSRLEFATASVVNNEAGALLQVASAGTSSFSGGYQGVINNSGTIVKTGAGTTPAPLTNLAGGVLKINEGAFGVTFSESNANAGSVEIAAGARLQSGQDLYNAGTIRGTGAIALGGTTGATLRNNGLVSPGASDEAGTLAIQGNYAQGPLGALNIRLGSTTSDVLDVDGSAQLGGTLNLSTLGGGIPSDGATADVVVARGSASGGAFLQVNAPSVVTQEKIRTLAVGYPIGSDTVARVTVTTAPTTPPAPNPPVVLPVLPPAPPPPVTTGVPTPTPTPSPAPAPTPPPSADICTIAPNSALCQVLSPPTASAPVKPVQQASNELLIAIAKSTPTELSVSEIGVSVAKTGTSSVDATSAPSTGAGNATAKKMYCN